MPPGVTPDHLAKAKEELGRQLFKLAQCAQASGWQAEELLRAETVKQEKILREKEKGRQNNKND